ncbi:hypothetical protein [Delftia acidovorans]|uniref:hypothetical protein n=1 Tax=Delftia acidovorans TaxID=80866 RepID=UPI0012D2AD12|nr:hypothetical protein [Delftia acidovorans]QQB51482.1 hypothetical protein I6H54_04180 [Delftia acidovorans]
MNESYDALLGSPASGWQEVSVQLAADKLHDFSPSDWYELTERALTKPAYWQERCAEAAGATGGEFADTLLTKLLNSDHLQVAAIAASELENMSVKPSPNLRPRLMQIYAYLESQQSPRKDDVMRLLRNM